MNKLSFVIPCYRSGRTITGVIEEIIAEVAKLKRYDYEIIATDDNSPDDVFSVLVTLAEANRKIKVIRFAKNFGQHAGMLAGLKASTGDIVVFLDDDGQCPMDKLPELIAPLEKGMDISIAQYGRKKQSVFKNICSTINEIAANLLINKPKELQMGNFMAIKRFVADEICRYDGPYPYISGLFFRSSANIVNVPMKERARLVGGTTYTLKKLFLLWLNSFTAFSIKPLRIATIMGFGASFLGMVYGIFLVVRKLVNPSIAIGWSSIMVTILVLGGAILFVLGLAGEYIGRIYMAISKTPQYVVRETVNIAGNLGDK